MTDDNKNSHFADKFFEDIEEFSESDNYFIPVLSDVALHLDIQSSCVLDVGCGTGLFLKPLIDAGCTQCYGVDGHNDYLDLAVRRGYKKVDVVDDLSSCKIPFDTEYFDLVVCKDVFEHLINPLHTLSEIKRVLKIGGLLLLHVPNHFPLIGRLKFLFTNNIDTFSFFNEESRWTFPHIRFYEHQDSLRILSDNDFTLVTDLSHHFQAIPFISRINKLHTFKKYLTYRFPNQFASGFTFLVKKG